MIVEKVLFKIRVFVATCFIIGSAIPIANASEDPPNSPEEIMGRMSLEEKVGQLLWLEVNDKTRDLKKLLHRYNPAGISVNGTDPVSIRNLSDILSQYNSKSRVFLNTDMAEIHEITLLPNFSTIQNISDSILIKRYHEAAKQQMEYLGVDRSVHYGMDLGLVLKNGTGHTETFKKQIYESDGVIISGDHAYWYGELFRMVKTGEIPRHFFEMKVKKVLQAKASGSSQKGPVIASTEDHLLNYFLNNGDIRALMEELYLKSFKIINDKDSSLPLTGTAGKRMAYINIGSPEDEVFHQYLNQYKSTIKFEFGSGDEIISTDLKDYDYVFLDLSGPVKKEASEFIYSLEEETRVIITYFGHSEELEKFSSNSRVLWHPERNEITSRLAPQILFGGLSINSDNSVYGEGNQIRLGYTIPETAGLDSRTLEQIDLIADELIRQRAAPGCQILVARNGKVVYNKSFGSLFYNDSLPVNSGTLYDLASITKVLATVPAIMYLDQVDLLDIDQRVSEYIYELRGSNKENIIIRDILMHQAGLFPYLPFWRQTVNEDGLIPELYSQEQKNEDWNLVSQGIYSNKVLQDSLWNWTIESRMMKTPPGNSEYDYKYSDLGFYILKELAERVSGMKLDQFTEKYIYRRMDLESLTFLPLGRHNPENIAPTEKDNYFRNNLIHGTVHDQIAAMFGGVAGHAGLFGNSNDIAKMMQMFLWDGHYGGINFYEENTIAEYTNRHDLENRRGLGWDKPDPNGEGNTSMFATYSSFGHTGFTGTSAWADPEFGLIYVFLSNRVHPFADNNKLAQENFRIRIQDVIYRSLQNYEKYHSFR